MIKKEINETAEEWRPIKGYEDRYGISSFGRIVSLNYKNGKHKRILSTRKKENATTITPATVLSASPRKPKTRTICRLVLETFVGKCPRGKEPGHLDGDPTNNRLSNLVYQTRAQRIKQNYKEGKMKAERRNAKFTWTEVCQMRLDFINGMTRMEIRDKYKIEKTMLRKMKK